MAVCLSVWIIEKNGYVLTVIRRWRLLACKCMRMCHVVFTAAVVLCACKERLSAFEGGGCDWADMLK